jgi:pyruvate formate-lyase activating enzyme-like uncharacterized protein
MDHSLPQNNMPRVLENIIADINNQGKKSKSDTGRYLSQWKRFAVSLKKEVPGIIAEDKNTTLRYGKMSPGCILCKKGKWDCIFMTMDCNLDCSFCYSPAKQRQHTRKSAFGSSIEQVADRYRRLGIKGIGFTGGEPLMEFESLIAWIKGLRHRLPGNYIWVYTNGLLLKEKYVDTITGSGLDEIRFNLAATGYSNKDILSIARYASRKIPAITVEIPAVPQDRDMLLPALESWIKAGVKYLNLHELICEPGTNSEIYREQCDMLTLEDGHRTGIMAQSRLLILEVLKFAEKKRLSLNINICSLSNKLKQIRDRRNNFGRLLKKSYERISDREFLETILIYRNSRDFRFINPGSYYEDRYKSYNAVRLIRRAPLSVYDTDEKYFNFQRIK